MNIIRIRTAGWPEVMPSEVATKVLYIHKQLIMVRFGRGAEGKSFIKKWFILCWKGIY